MDLAVLGMGNMGRAIARRLVDGGHHVVVWNRTPGKADGFTEAGSPAEAAAGAAATLVMMTGDEAVESTLLPVLDGGLVVNCSTCSPASTQRLTEAYAARFVAAPVLGAPGAVASGAATWVLGGAAREQLAPVWDALGDKRLDCGDDPVDAATVKIVSNNLLLSGLAVLGEAVATAQAAGLDAGLVRTLFESSILVPPGLKNRLDDVLGGDHSSGWFAASLGLKDLGLFRDLARGAGVTTRAADGAHAAFTAIVDAGRDRDDVAAVVEAARGA